mmetsp:Transcript_21915/g.45650  ORF Transcript_21915/g.45650 Transcript_21915/m.45650 type:complete len:89 (+) Transcript_21915:174-440(+)|eukprot:CAMPEP_0118633278 /NCGR_PEP_ID=MMETSP0785-20121206/908_1 /TAXON_ID=91992 /ORGANISM="Bolidomonas pacifica, Strain CCMP 1866" /LENGTH=88 /DNA_ID=CAMNT_0006524135 /DNA_START=117 /DNA_END=383 /DNA_ORIENTATION=-
MVYSIVVHHRHKSGHKTLIQGDEELLGFMRENIEPSSQKDITDPNTTAVKLQVTNVPLYVCFNKMEEAGWKLVNGFGGGTADQYVFHK